MFILLAIVLALAWLGLKFALGVTGLLFHLLLVFAVISLVMHFITGRKSSTV